MPPDDVERNFDPMEHFDAANRALKEGLGENTSIVDVVDIWRTIAFMIMVNMKNEMNIDASEAYGLLQIAIGEICPKDYSSSDDSSSDDSSSDDSFYMMFG